MDTLQRQIQTAQEELQRLLEQAEQPDANREALIRQATEALSNSLEELHVSQEELHEQNKQLQEAQAQLEAERRRFVSLFNFAPDGYLVTDVQGVIREANRAAAELLDVEHDRLVGMPLAFFVSYAEQIEIYDLIRRFEAGKAVRSQRWETELQHHDDAFPVSISVGPLRNRRGDVTRLLWLIRDITERERAEQALRESEQRFELFMQHLPAAVYIKDLEERIVYANQRFADILGVEPETLIGVNADRLTPRDLMDQYRQENERVLNGETLETETVFPGAEGPRHWLVYKFPLSRKGKLVLIGSVAVDITERKQAEAALRASEEKYRTLFEDALNPIFIVDEEGRYLDANAAALAFVECDRETLLEKTVWDFTVPGMEAQVQDEHAPFFASRTLETDYQIDGTVKTLLLNVVPVSSPDQRVLYGIGQDITERKRVEDALRASKRKYENLYNSIRDAILVVDTDRRIMECNPAFTELFGYTLDEIKGKRTLHLYDDREAFEELGKALREGQHRANFFVTIDYRKKSGETFPGETNVFYLREDGEIRGFIGLIRDVTERRAAQEKIQHYAAELERSNRELQQFAYVVSHDLRAPLTTVKGYLQLLQSDHQDQPKDDKKLFLDQAVDGIERMRTMINALLELARVETKKKPLAATDVEEILAWVLNTLKHVINETEAEITHDPLPTVLADDIQLTQLFQNLIANALKFRRADVPPRVHVSAERDGGMWLFSVTDNGIGIDPQQADRIFQVFQRLHTAEEYPGIGMGLPLCRRIVERHGGRIWVTSTPGEGATFKFTLPTSDKVDTQGS